MNDDEPTHNLNSDQEVNATQPTITAVFRLLRDLDTRLNGRLDKIENRLDALESRVSVGFESIEIRFAAMDGRFAAMDGRFADMDGRFVAMDGRFAALSDEMKAGLLQLSDKVCDRIDRSRLHAESDYEDLLRRLRKLESKAS